MKRNTLLRFTFLVFILATLALTWWPAPLTASSSEASGVEWHTFLEGSHVSALAVQGAQLWVGTTEGLYRLNPTDGSQVQYTTADGLPDNRVRALAVDRQGRLWAGTEAGLGLFDGATWTIYTTQNSILMHDYVSALFVDGEGRVWIGTGAGANQVVDGDWYGYPVIDEEWDTFAPAVTSIAVDFQGRAWFGNFGVHVFDGQHWKAYKTINSDLIGNAVKALTVDGRGRLWAGTETGISVFDRTGWTSYTQQNSTLTSDWVQALTTDREGRVWAGTDWGLSFFDGTRWLGLKALDVGLLSDNVRAVAFDERGWIWVGTDRGLAGAESNQVMALAMTLGAVPSPAGARSPQPPLRQVWATSFPDERGVLKLISTGDRVYATSVEGVVHALEAASGQELWQVGWWESPSAARCPYDPPQLKGMRGSDYYFRYRSDRHRLAAAGNTLVASLCAGWTEYEIESQLFALFLGADNGEIRGVRPLATGGVLGTAGNNVILNAEEEVLAVEADTGQPVWKVERGDLASLRARLMTEEVVLIAKDEAGESYGSRERRLAAHAIADGSLRWEIPVPGDLLPRAATGGRWFAIGGTQLGAGSLIAFDLTTGQELWVVDLAWLGYDVSSAEVEAYGDKVYLYANSYDGPGLTAYDAATGLKVWTAAPGSNGLGLAVLDDMVYFLAQADSELRLYALNPANGTVQWSGSEAVGMEIGAADNERLYLIGYGGPDGSDGLITAYQPRQD